MREPERIDRMIEKLRLAWHNNPDMRLSQLIWNIAHATGTAKTKDVFYVEDDVFEVELNHWFRKAPTRKGDQK